MTPNLLIREHLTAIRDGMKKVCRITRSLGDKPQQADLDNALFLRETVLSAEVDKKARELSAAFPDWHARVKNDDELRGLLGEAEDLMHSIVGMDEEISKSMQCRMGAVKAKMATIYRTSRAAGSYTAQSKLRVKTVSQA